MSINAIVNRINNKGSISFAEFMHLALYDKEFGYYASGINAIGEGGDFITAPELTSLFGKSLANQIKEIMVKIPHGIVFEFGAGSGKLCIDILSHLKEQDALPDKYIILEVSEKLRHNQIKLITEKIPELLHLVKWVEKLPEDEINGVIIANEVLDAMPVHRFLKVNNEVLESYIDLHENNSSKECELKEIFIKCNNQKLINHVNNILSDDVYPYISEVNLFVEPWIAECANILNQGAMLILDYGFAQSEYYHPDRKTGTLMCHFKHSAHPNPLINIGLQDITAHVDFTYVAESAFKAGFDISGYVNQASFLIANDLLGLLEKIKDNKEKILATQAVKKLLNPSEMGELFKVMALTKSIDFKLSGFNLFDKRASL